MSLARVEVAQDTFFACLSHALSTDKEEIMGLLFGEHIGHGGLVCCCIAKTDCRVIDVTLHIWSRINLAPSPHPTWRECVMSRNSPWNFRYSVREGQVLTGTTKTLSSDSDNSFSPSQGTHTRSPLKTAASSSCVAYGLPYRRQEQTGERISAETRAFVPGTMAAPLTFLKF